MGVKMEKNYVAHDCRNSRNSETLPKKARNGKTVYVPNPEYCNNRWVDVDKTGAKTQIPNWKYCRECCEKMGINFEKQKPSDYRTDERNEQIKKNIERLREARNKNINSDIV